MIETLKAELKLRPTYDELIGMIESQGDPNRPSIEQVIDRRATIFRNNQFGSQFDNLDFLGLKKQEEDRARDNLRNAQLRKAGVDAGTSTGMVGLRAMGFETPSEVYEMDDEEDDIMLNEDIARIRTEMERHRQRQQEAQQASSSTARSGLDEAHSQSLPVGVPVHSMATDEEDVMPPLEDIEEGEEEEEFEDDPELIPADDDETTKAPGQARKHKETIDYNDITKWKQRDVSTDDILFQLYLRGITLEKEQEEDIGKLRNKGKGREMTKKDYLLNFIEKLMMTGQWTNEVNGQLIRSRMREWREMKKGKGKGSGEDKPVPSKPAEASSSSSTPLRDIAVAGAKAGAQELAKAGAQVIAKSFYQDKKYQ